MCDHDRRGRLASSAAHRLSMLNFLLSTGLRPSIEALARFWQAEILEVDESMLGAWEEATRVFLSHCDHLLIQYPADYLFYDGPARHKPCLSQILSAVYPPYQARPLSERVDILDVSFTDVSFIPTRVDDVQLFSMILGYESWSPEVIAYSTPEHVGLY